MIIYFTHGKRDQQKKKLRKTRIKLELFEGGAVNKFYERGLKVALDSSRVKETLMRNGIDNANKGINTIRKSAASHLVAGNGFRNFTSWLGKVGLPLLC